MWLRRIALSAAVAGAAFVPATPAAADHRPASCVGNHVSIVAPALGSGFGAAISGAAQNPALVGHSTFGAYVSALNHGTIPCPPPN